MQVITLRKILNLVIQILKELDNVIKHNMQLPRPFLQFLMYNICNCYHYMLSRWNLQNSSNCLLERVQNKEEVLHLYEIHCDAFQLNQ